MTDRRAVRLERADACLMRCIGLTLCIGLMLCASLFVPSLALADEIQLIILPSAAASDEADTHLVFPWDCAVSVTSLRQQQIYLGAGIGQGEIVEIRFRQDGELGEAFGPVVLSDVTIQLASTDVAVEQLSLTFANNLGGDARVVYQGDLTLSSPASAEVPRPFDVVIALQNPFPFNGKVSNLVLDVILPQCFLTTALDASLVTDDEVARIWETDAMAETTSRVDSFGLVTEFVIQTIFSGGFETGDTSRWTLSFP